MTKICKPRDSASSDGPCLTCSGYRDLNNWESEDEVEVCK